MSKLKLFISLLLLLTTPTILFPQNYSAETRRDTWMPPTTYDGIIDLLYDIESGKVERTSSRQQLARINHFIAFLAEQGSFDESYSTLMQDVAALKSNPYAQYEDLSNAINGSSSQLSIFQCSKLSKAWKSTKNFVKEHKKEIIIGAAIVVAVTVIIVASVPAGAVAAGGGAAGGLSSSGSSVAKAPSESISVTHEIEKKAKALKQTIAKENLLESDVPMEETGKALGALFAHKSLNDLQKMIDESPEMQNELKNIAKQYNFSTSLKDNAHYTGHTQIDKEFCTNYSFLFSQTDSETDFTALSYKVRGEVAQTFGCHEQATEDFSKALTIDPTDHDLYLQRSVSQFGLGNFEQSRSDFEQYAKQYPPLSAEEFTFGFIKGLPKGIYESGQGMMLFVGDLITRPIHTASEIYTALSTLAKLGKENEWSTIGKALSPEVHKLVSEWDTLDPERRGRLAGYALGKHGTDIIAPGAIAKVASKSAKGAREITTALKNLQRAENTLILETAAAGSATKVAQTLNKGQQVLKKAENLGFTTKEMASLKQAGKLESTVQKVYNHLELPKKQSIAHFKKAQVQLKPYAKKTMPEYKARALIHETGLPTFPRPKGIPENYVVKLTKTGAGIEYVDPTNRYRSVRVMPGKPHSPNTCQQKPYVVHMKDGKAIDKYGNMVPHNTPEAHVPLNEFIFRE